MSRPGDRGVPERREPQGRCSPRPDHFSLPDSENAQRESLACSRCDRVLARDEFARDSSRKSGIKSWCKRCDRERARRYYAGNSEAKRAYYLANRDRILEQAAERNAKRKGAGGSPKTAGSADTARSPEKKARNAPSGKTGAAE